MHLPTNISKKLWPFIAALFCLFLGLGAAGWKLTLEKAAGHAEIGEVLENTVEMVTGRDVIVVDHKFQEHWMLMLGKWGVKAVLAVALLESALLIFHRQIRQWRLRKVRGHQVFVGLAGYNADLALMAATHGQPVAVVEEDEHHPRRGELEQARVVVISGSASDPQKLKAAGVDRAARVVVAATGGDDASIASAEVVASLGSESKGSRRQLLVCLEARQTRELLNQRWSLVVQPKAWQTKILSFQAAALRQMVVGIARELANSAAVMQRGPRILVVAEEEFTNEFLRAAIPFIQISGEALPQYWVAVGDANEKAAFDLLHPAAGLVAQVHFVETGDRLVAACPEFLGLEFDVAVIKLSGESRTLQLAEKLLRSPQFEVGWVEAVVPEAVGTRLVEDARLRVVSIFKLGLNSPEFGDLSLETKARENHEAYLAGLKSEERVKAHGWDEMPENLKESNRWAVLHRAIKREIWENTKEAERGDMIEHLSICEHQRWMGEKAMDGWRHTDSPVQDKRRRLHPSLVPWAQLSNDEKEKDRVQVRKGFD